MKKIDDMPSVLTDKEAEERLLFLVGEGVSSWLLRDIVLEAFRVGCRYARGVAVETLKEIAEESKKGSK